MKKREQLEPASTFPYEVLTTAGLAEGLKVKESWVVDQSKHSRTADPMIQSPSSGWASIVATYGVRRSLTHGSVVATVPQERVRRGEAGDDVELIGDVLVITVHVRLSRNLLIFSSADVAR